MHTLPARSTRLLLSVVTAVAVAAPAGSASAEDATGRTGPAPAEPVVAATTSSSSAATLPAPFTRFSRPAAAARWQVAELGRAVDAAIAADRPWDGSVARCDAGSLSTSQRARVVDLVNLHRHVVGVPALLGTHAPSDHLAQEAALVMEANNSLSHDPPRSWACWSQEASDGAGSSNLAIGYSWWEQVPAYIIDDGDNNRQVGHRQWLLDPTLERIGVGATARGGAIRVIDVPTRSSNEPRVVTWPAAGNSPAFLLADRWSVSFHQLPVDLSRATVRVTRGGTQVPVTFHGATVGYGGFRTLSWEMPTAAMRDAATAGPRTTTFRVEVRDVRVDGTDRDYRYDVTVVPDRFTDDDGGIFEADAIVLAADGVTRGCNDAGTRFCPDQELTRGQLAAMLVRAHGLPRATRDWFTDDDGTLFERDNNALAEAGITRGCSDDGRRYCPDRLITRAEIATLFDRSFSFRATSRDWFRDDAGSIHQAAINRFREAGVTLGCNPPVNDRFCPGDPVTRGQIAAFFVRSGLVPTPR